MKFKSLVAVFVSFVGQSCAVSAPSLYCVGLTRDQRLYVRECLSQFGEKEHIDVGEVQAIGDDFFRDVLLDLMGDKQAVAIESIQNMLKRKK